MLTTGRVTSWGGRALLAVAATVLLGLLAPVGVAMAGPPAEPDPDQASSAEAAVESPVDDAEDDEDEAADVPEAPGAKGQPPRPPMAASTMVAPRSSAVIRLA